MENSIKDSAFRNSKYLVLVIEIAFALLLGVISGFIMRISPYIDIVGIGLAMGVPVVYSIAKIQPRQKIAKSIWKPFVYSAVFLITLKFFAQSRLYMVPLRYIFVYCGIFFVLSILFYLISRMFVKKENRNAEECKENRIRRIKGMLVFDVGLLLTLTIYFLIAFLFMPQFDSMEKVPYDTLITVLNIVLAVIFSSLITLRLLIVKKAKKDFGNIGGRVIALLTVLTIALLVFISITLSSCTQKDEELTDGNAVRIGTAAEGHSLFEEIGDSVISQTRGDFENTADCDTPRSLYIKDMDAYDDFVIQFNFQRGKIENEYSVVKAPYGFVIGYADQDNYVGIHFDEQESVELYKMEGGKYTSVCAADMVYAPVFIKNYVEIKYADNMLEVLLNDEVIFNNQVMLKGQGIGCYIDTVDVQRNMDDLNKFFDKITPYNKPPYFAVNEISIYAKESAPVLDVPVITVKQPYILWNNADGVNIIWETNKAAEAVFSYWQEGGQKQTVNCDKNKYGSVWINDFNMQTEYFYEIESEGVLIGQGMFETEKNPGETIKVLFLSDNHINPVFKDVVDIVDEKDFDFIMHTGDVVDDGINVNEFNENFFRNDSNYLFSHTPVYAAIGNHDHHSSRRWFNTFFPYPNRTELADNTMSQNFCLTYSNCAFFVLDLYTEQEETMDQLKWMKEQLGREDVADKQWKFVLIHEPPYGVDRGTWKLASEFSREELLPFMKEHDLEILISGHEHIYKAGQFGDVLTIVNGGAGGNGYGWTKPYQAVANLMGYTSYNYCIAEIDDEKVVWTCYGFMGEVMDSFIIE